mmetsp:Transcript_104206/g.334319  ORF Transcript_104206/g.334319 Transcript_104206/m.334319 type:complete len:117 (-) Transcript_104206:27-377(-)
MKLNFDDVQVCPALLREFSRPGGSSGQWRSLACKMRRWTGKRIRWVCQRRNHAQTSSQALLGNVQVCPVPPCTLMEYSVEPRAIAHSDRVVPGIFGARSMCFSQPGSCKRMWVGQG